MLSEVGQRPVSDVSRPVGDLSISGGVCIESLCQRPVNIEPSRSTIHFFPLLYCIGYAHHMPPYNRPLPGSFLMVCLLGVLPHSDVAALFVFCYIRCKKPELSHTFYLQNCWLVVWCFVSFHIFLFPTKGLASTLACSINPSSGASKLLSHPKKIM